jgi:hypothetical protein
VRDALERYFDETGKRAYRLTAQHHRGWKFPNDAAFRTVLEPAALWERVLAPSWVRKARLMEDPDVPQEHESGSRKSESRTWCGGRGCASSSRTTPGATGRWPQHNTERRPR